LAILADCEKSNDLHRFAQFAALRRKAILRAIRFIDFAD